jgi:ribosomal-protein-alanine N-acetyltransferase
MIVRPAQPADEAALGEIHAAAFDDPWTGAEILRFALDHGGFALVAETAGAPAGFILCRSIAGEAEVLTLAVRPEARRRGVGERLLAGAIALAGLADAPMFLEVAADNIGALALYDKAGFERVGRRAGYYRRPEAPAVDAIVMRRPAARIPANGHSRT